MPPVVAAALALAPALVVLLLGERAASLPLPALLTASALLALLLAVAIARRERRLRQSRQRWLRDRLERAVGTAHLHEGTLTLVRPGPDARRAIRTYTASGHDLLDPKWSLHARLDRSQPGAHGEVAIRTTGGVIPVEAPAAVVFGHARSGRGWELREGESVLVAARLASRTDATGFRTTVARSAFEPALPDGYPALVPLLGLARPSLRRRVLAAALLPLGALSLGTTLGAARHVRSSSLVTSIACAEQAAASLDQGDPWSAARQLDGCDAPQLEARSHWALGQFERASDAFARLDATESSVSEVEAHALAGHHLRAARAARRLPLSRFAHIDERECLAVAFEARHTPLGDAGPLRQPRPLCRVLGRDLARLGRLAPDQLPDDESSTWQHRPVTDAVRLAVDALAPSLSPPERIQAGLRTAGGTASEVTDLGAALRHRPLALHGQLLAIEDDEVRQLARSHGSDGEWASARSLLRLHLGLERALVQAQTEPDLVPSTLRGLELLRTELRENEGGTWPDLDPRATVFRGYHDRDIALQMDWASHHAGDRLPIALFLAPVGDDLRKNTLWAWARLRSGEPVAWAAMIGAEPAGDGRELLRLASSGDARPVVTWLRDHRQDGREILDRLLDRLPTHHDDLVAFVAHQPLHRRDSGLTALLEHTSTRALLARRLAVAPLADDLRALSRQLLAHRLDARLEVPFLLMEQLAD